MIVLDASVALAWCFGDEQSATADQALEQLRAGGALVPSIWPFEVANGLLAAERRGRVASDDRQGLLELLGALPIEVEDVTLLQTLAPVTEIARMHDLSVYDAAYIELAVRIGLPIATLDRRLEAAAESLGIVRVR